MLGQLIVSGLATGAIYALLGLAVVLIYQTTRHINLAQGEMAAFTTFIAWQLLSWGVPYWLAFGATVVIAFVIGAGVRYLLMAPLKSADARYQLGAMTALFLIFNSVAGFIWGQDIKVFPTPFGIEPVFGSTLISGHRVGMIGVTFILLLALQLFLTRTGIGLRLRAAAENPVSARIVGIRVDRVQMLGWGLAAAFGAVAGMLIAPVVFLEPQMMFVVFPYVVAAAVLGGLNNPTGAVVAGFVLGVVEALATAYLPIAGREMKLTFALAVILAVLVIRPQGLLGVKPVDRV
jgi:branched-chain amino acid transport system permease protein